MADAVEAARQDVEEETADELGRVERHGPEPVSAFDAVVLPLEGDALVVQRHEPGVRDCDAVGVAGEVGEDGLRPGERPLGVDDPFGAAQRREFGVEGAFVGERGEIDEEGEAAGGMQGREPFEEESAEETRQMRLKAAKVLLRRLIGRLAEEGRKGSDMPDVVFLHLLLEPARRHVVDHALTQRAYGLVGHRESSCLPRG